MNTYEKPKKRGRPTTAGRNPQGVAILGFSPSADSRMQERAPFGAFPPIDLAPVHGAFFFFGQKKSRADALLHAFDP
jgi:hypothetical protein